MSKIKAVFKSIDWYIVFSIVSGLLSIFYVLNGIGLMVEYGSWVDWELFEPIFYAGISLGVSVFFSYLGASFAHESLVRKKDKCDIGFSDKGLKLRHPVLRARPCPVCKSCKYLRFHIVHESDIETVYDFGCDKCGVCGYDAHDKTMAFAFWNRCVKEDAEHIRRAVFMTSKEYAEKVRSSGGNTDAD